MTDNKEIFTTTPDTQVAAGSVAPDVSAPLPVVEENKTTKTIPAPQATEQEETKEYYNVKIPTLGTAFKQLWKVGKFIAKKADPIADKAIDTLVGGIAKVSGLPDPKT
jgi:hypothetical protein